VCLFSSYALKCVGRSLRYGRDLGLFECYPHEIMTTIRRLTLSIALITVNQFLGPLALLLTPVIVGIISILILKANLKLFYRIPLIVLAIISNDMLIKLNAGVNNDTEGVGWMNLLLVFGVFVATILTFFELKFSQYYKLSNVLLSTFFIPFSTGIYLSYFGFFGLINDQPSSESVEISKSNQTFVSNLTFSDHLIMHENDSIHILNGWSEKQKRVNHTGFFRKQEYTGKINYIVKTQHNLESTDSPVYYQINSRNINGARPVDSTIKVSLPQSDSIVYLTFFKLRGTVKNDTIIKEIKINSR
jgi:hypothetical protein